MVAECAAPAHVHAFLWGLGNGLVSAHLLRYLVRDLYVGQDAASIAAVYAWIIAAPRIAGVLRLWVPALIVRSGNRKRFCVVNYLISPLFLLGLPLLLPAMVRMSAETENIAPAMTMLIVFWCVHHLFDYFGSIALFSWFGDLVPEERRGRFLGRREAWLVAGMALGLLSLGLYSYFVIDQLPKDVERWRGYLEPTYLGIFCLFASVIPLTLLPRAEQPRAGGCTPGPRRTSQIFAPLKNPRFAAFVFFGCWVQMSQALTQGPQYHFSINVLSVSMLVGLAMSTTTRIGQWSLGTTMGAWSDRLGTAPVMTVSLFLAATGSLFYYFSTPETWWLLFGAAAVWIFWVGVNIGISKTILDLAPREESSSYLALYFTFTTLTFALCTLFGGHWIPKDLQRESFLLSFVLRILAIPILLFVFRFAQKKV